MFLLIVLFFTLQNLIRFLEPLLKKSSEGRRNYSVIKSLRFTENLQVCINGSCWFILLWTYSWLGLSLLISLFIESTVKDILGDGNNSIVSKLHLCGNEHMTVLSYGLWLQHVCCRESIRHFSLGKRSSLIEIKISIQELV